MRALIVQTEPTYLAGPANRAAVDALLEGEGGGADLIVLPELFASGYFFHSEADLLGAAEPVPGGPTTAWLEALARRTSATIVAGLPELHAGRVYNAAVVVTPDGLAGRYRKVHLFYEETRLFAPGDLGFPVFDLRDRNGHPYRLGVMVCFDWRFPEAARTLALQGADVIAHPANLVRPNCPRTMPIRALENHVFTLTANRIGTDRRGDESLSFIGRSLACDPDGEVLAEAPPDAPAVLAVEFDPARARDRQLTPYNHLFADRRPEAYHLEARPASSAQA